MLERCPCCERNLKSLKDFPLIYLHNFERLSIPINSVFPFKDRNIFVDSTSDLENEKALEEVINFFSNNLTEKIFHYEGWEWKIERRENYGNNYHRTQLNQKEIIEKTIDPYLKKLENLVGKNISLKEFLPNFNKNGYFKFAFDIPNTDYYLSFEEDGIDNNFRIAKIKILGKGLNLGSNGGPTLTDLSEVGKLIYEGRLKYNFNH